MVNDNAFRVALILFVLSMVTGEARQVRYSSLATALIPLPYILFSPLAGYLADRFPKHRVLLWTKAPEIISMLLAAVGFYLRSLPFLYFVLFLVASRAAFFSPAKFGILPEILSDAGISAANGILELVSDIAILVGSLLGVYAYSLFASNLANAGLVYVAIAGLGTVAILFVPRTPSGHPGAEFAWNVLRSFGRDYAEVRGNPTLFYTLVGITWFGFIASFFLTVIPVFGKSELGLDRTGVGLLFALLAIGIGMGAVAAGRLSRGHRRDRLGADRKRGYNDLFFSPRAFGYRAHGAVFRTAAGCRTRHRDDRLLVGIFRHPAQCAASAAVASRNERTANRLRKCTACYGAILIGRWSALDSHQRVSPEHPRGNLLRCNT